MTKQIMSNEKKGLAKWSTRDLLVTAVLSIVFAVILTGATYLVTIFIMPLGPLAMFASTGLWSMPSIFIAYILRRPGAALLGQSIISLVTIPFSPHGWMELLAILARGIPTELVFFATRYRNYRLSVLMLAGIVTGVIAVAIFWGILGMGLMSRAMQIANVAVAMISYAAAGWLAKLLADAIAKTGVLSSYAVGQEMQEEV